MKIKWEVHDGYVGAGRPQCAEIPDDKLAEVDPEEMEHFIDDWVVHDFLDKVHASYDLDAAVSEALAIRERLLAAREDEE